MTHDDEQEGTVKSDTTLFTILEALFELEQAGVTELGEHLDSPKSSVHKHLKTMRQSGYVLKQNGKYRLGFKFLTLGGKVRDHNRLCSIGDELIHELAAETDRLVAFAIREHDRGVFTSIYNDKYGLREAVPLGKRFPLHANAAGKAMLSELEDQEIDSIIKRQGLDPRTENTIVDREELLKEIEEVRGRGFSISMGERIEGVHAISANVVDQDTGDIGAISLSGPVGRMSKGRIEGEYAEVIIDAANELELQVKYR